MATLDHIILKVNDLDASVGFYTSILGFVAEGRLAVLFSLEQLHSRKKALIAVLKAQLKYIG